VVARLPHSSTPAAIAARIIEAIAGAGAALDGAITIVEHARVRILRAP
jgi:hypothetical protein